MAIRSKEVLKSYFKTGDVPSETNFSDLIDSFAHATTSIEHTYQELKSLIINNNLDTSKKYILTDYIHKYYIENSNSSGITSKRIISDNISGYAVFGGLVEDMPTGTEVTITKLPENYSGSANVGDKQTITAVYSNYYFLFSGGIQSIVGLELEYFIKRYNTINENELVNDSNGKPVLKQDGIINTEVHDGTAYMDMTAEENLAPSIERILLTPSSNNSFKTIAESLTYLGDFVHYNFDDSDIKNDNDKIIGQRNGFINRRINEELFIDLKYDWREQKFRRWLLSDNDIDQFINVDQDANDTNIMTAYDGKFLFTSELRTKSNPQFFYIIPKPEYSLQNLNNKGKVKTFEAKAKSIINAKDYSIFQLDENKNPVNVIQCKTDFIENTVFQLNGGTFNLSLNIDNISQVFNSTFTSYINVENGQGTTIQKVISLDSMFMTNMSSSDLNSINFLGYTGGSITNSTLENAIFGTPKKLDLLGPGPHESVGWINLNLIECRFKNVSYGSYTTTIEMANFTAFDSCLFFYSNKTNLLQDNIISSSIFNNTIFRCLYNTISTIIIGMIIPKTGTDETVYTIPKVLNSIQLKRISTSGELFYEEESLNGNSFTKSIYIWNQSSNDWVLTS